MRLTFVLAIAGIGLTYAFRGAFFGLLFYLWVAYFRPEQWVWDPIVSSLNLSLIAGLCTVVGAVFSQARWRMNARVLIMGLFLVHSLLSTLLGQHPDYAWPYWVEFSRIVIISYLMVVLVDDVKKFRIVLLVIGLSLGLEAAKQGWIEMILHPGSLNANPLPMLGDNNGVAVGMMMLVPILTALSATTSNRWEKLLHRFLAIGVLYRGLCTYSRGGFLACGALGLVYLLRSKRKLAAAVGIIATALVIVPVLQSAFWDRMSTIKAPVEEGVDVDDSALGRLHFWNVAVEMANTHPIFGVGHNSFNVSYDRFDDLNGRFGRGRSVHSTWFGILAELGYPGLLLFLAQIGLAYHACWRARKASRLGGEHAVLGRFAFALEAGLTAFVVGGTFLPFQYTEMLWNIVGLSIALHTLAEAALRASANQHSLERGGAQAFHPREAAVA